MTDSFFFYDLETTGFDSRGDRITQFGGQRTNMKLEAVGKPINLFIKLTTDILPDPQAVLITGITPQQTIKEGLSEADFLEIFNKEISIPGTTFVGYNNVRFDDEFMRFMLYRNLYDPYVWQWQDGRSRWDLIDVVRMTRALRPEGINWPVDEQGKASNRLGLLAAGNNLKHENAHDALSDVLATIEVSKLIYEKQPKLFEYLYSHRTKKAVAELAKPGQTFVYTSSKYEAEFCKTTVVQSLSTHPSSQGVLVYDLRIDPLQFKDSTSSELAEVWRYDPLEKKSRFPIKSLLFNRCPAIAPLGVMDKASQQRLNIDIGQINIHRQSLLQMPDFLNNVTKAIQILDKERNDRQAESPVIDVDAKLYEGFFGDFDRRTMAEIHRLKPNQMDSKDFSFHDSRLVDLYKLYIARNYPDALNAKQLAEWETRRQRKLLQGGKDSKLVKYSETLAELAKKTDLSVLDKKLLKKLEEWVELIRPRSEAGENK